jgi:hypothetical protein
MKRTACAVTHIAGSDRSHILFRISCHSSVVKVPPTATRGGPPPRGARPPIVEDHVRGVKRARRRPGRSPIARAHPEAGRRGGMVAAGRTPCQTATRPRSGRRGRVRREVRSGSIPRGG